MEACCALFWSTRYLLTCSSTCAGRFPRSIGRSISAIEEEIVAREKLGPSRPPHRPKNKPLPTATTLVAKESSAATPLCCYCNQQHRTTDCTVVIQVDERKQLLWRAGQCFSCLRRGHLSRNCQATNRCQQCYGKHHTSICSGSTY